MTPNDLGVGHKDFYKKKKQYILTVLDRVKISKDEGKNYE